MDASSLAVMNSLDALQKAIAGAFAFASGNTTPEPDEATAKVAPREMAQSLRLPGQISDEAMKMFCAAQVQMAAIDKRKVENAALIGTFPVVLKHLLSFAVFMTIACALRPHVGAWMTQLGLGAGSAGVRENPARDDAWMVRKGDSLEQIGKKLGCRDEGARTRFVIWVQQHNSDVVRSANHIRPGMILHLPSAAQITKLCGTKNL